MNSPAPRRIIHVPRRFVAEEWGGTETVILEISRRQQADGFLPEIHTSMALAHQRREEIGGVPVIRYPYCYPFLGLDAAAKAALDKKGGNLLSFRMLFGLRGLSNVRLFHAHALNRMGGMVRAAARRQRRPYVVSLHGGVFDVPPSEFAGMAKPTEGKFEWGKPFGALVGARRVLDDADQVICVGRNEAEKASAKFGKDRVSYLPNGVDCAKFARGDGAAFRAKHGLPAEALVVLTLSRIDAQKNQMLLVEAFAKLKAARTGPCRLVLIGPQTQPDYAQALRETAARSGTSDSLLLLPGLRTDDPDLVNAYHAADVFVLPSIHEPFGIVVLEAWSAGLPVVCSGVGGLQALTEHGRTALVFDPKAGDAADALCAHLAALAADPARARALGEAGREEARKCYDWTVVAARLEEIYRQAEARATRRYGP